jgi:hypothetical protein
MLCLFIIPFFLFIIPYVFFHFSMYLSFHNVSLPFLTILVSFSLFFFIIPLLSASYHSLMYLIIPLCLFILSYSECLFFSKLFLHHSLCLFIIPHFLCYLSFSYVSFNSFLESPYHSLVSPKISPYPTIVLLGVEAICITIQWFFFPLL